LTPCLAKMLFTLTSGMKKSIMGKINEKTFIPDFPDDFTNSLVPGSHTQGVLISQDSSVKPLTVQISRPQNVMEHMAIPTLKFVPHPQTLPGPSKLYLDSNLNTPISGEYMPEIGIFKPDQNDKALFTKLTQGQLRNKGKVVYNIPGSEPIPMFTQASSNSKDTFIICTTDLTDRPLIPGNFDQ
jgi:hypothetical protein